MCADAASQEEPWHALYWKISSASIWISNGPVDIQEPLDKASDTYALQKNRFVIPLWPQASKDETVNYANLLTVRSPSALSFHRGLHPLQS